MATRPQALVYRGNAACDGCSEVVAHVLETSPYHFNVTYCGPDESVDLSAEVLSSAAVYAYPGGPDLNSAWKEIKEHAEIIRNFVRDGGRYMGFCLGAYLAGRSPGLGLLPKGIDTDSECEQEGAQVSDGRDAVIQVDWEFNSGSPYSNVQRGRWLYFQEGAMLTGFKGEDPRILARYSSNGDVAASATSFGRGFVGLTGPHPEATKDWFKLEISWYTMLRRQLTPTR
ncbi:hypothetical protein B0I35DRAFT_158096 [Stachybotrys elegans]|uniref:Biotin-protein ligase N-terminal domain-containing protein n=1 Tax=Stachybotrys elegans TaxID=80388 RepID=A0A8K0SVL4_9HYPO|nr:hypothetical protein B0I35DRAFT_158096 [Stachybotrys elegans]